MDYMRCGWLSQLSNRPEGHTRQPSYCHTFPHVRIKWGSSSAENCEDDLADLFWAAAVSIHIASAAIWVGGNVLLHVVVNPKLRIIPPSPGGMVARGIGRRFEYLSWGAIGLLSTTGLLMAWRLGVLDPAVLLGTWFGFLVLFLIVATGLAIVNGLIISLYLTPRTVAVRAPVSEREILVAQASAAAKAITDLSVFNTVLGFISIVVGVLLRFGG